MRKNILFNTTRQWNVGDQIIMLGILRLLRHLDFNIFIYNRHPTIWGKGGDNSFSSGDHSLKNIDYYISAGTPEWTDKRLEPLFDELLKRKIPTSFIGLGVAGQDELFNFPSLMNVIEQADVLTARDMPAYKTIAPLGGHLLPCPGFLCGELPIKPRTKLNTIGLIFLTAENKHNAISITNEIELINGYKAVIAEYNAIIICHYIDEALMAKDYFPDTPIFYSYDAKDFEKFYSRCDLVIGPRLHGVLLAAGIGIPSFITREYDQGGEARRLGATEPLEIPSLITSSPAAFLDAIKNIDIEKESERLIDLRYKTEATYLTLLSMRMQSLYDTPFLKTQVRLNVDNLKT